VWAPDERHEAVRDLVRGRAAAAFDLRVKRQQAGAFLLRLGRVYPGKKTWGGAHRKWLASQAFAHLEQRIAFEELVGAMDETKARVARLEKAIEEAVPDWSLAPTVMGLMAMRGIDLVAATTILAEVGDLGRFQSPRELIASGRSTHRRPNEDAEQPRTKLGHAEQTRALELDHRRSTGLAPTPAQSFHAIAPPTHEAETGGCVRSVDEGHKSNPVIVGSGGGPWIASRRAP
jgi:transposase